MAKFQLPALTTSLHRGIPRSDMVLHRTQAVIQESTYIEYLRRRNSL